jgi:quercetin dioxygenase-like cupin family protein
MSKYWKRVAWLILPAALAILASASAEESVVAMAPDEAALKWFECGGFPKGCEAAWVWGNAEKAQSGFYVRGPKGYLFPRHVHTSPERILVLRGRISGAIDGGAEVMVTPGMYWGFAGNAVHWARCEDACLMYITYDTAFDVAFR